MISTSRQVGRSIFDCPLVFPTSVGSLESSPIAPVRVGLQEFAGI
jgi:hypothetical protein